MKTLRCRECGRLRPFEPAYVCEVCFGPLEVSYDLAAAYCHVRGVYTNKAPGGVAYSCSFRITEAVYLV